MALSLSNLKDSIDRVLFERMSSPLFGTYLFAWCIWNWKIIYVTLFVEEQQVVHKNKLDFIALELMEPNYIYWYPIYSTIAVLLLYPILSNASYWLSLQFTKWKRAIKHKWEETTPLTKEESNNIRREYLEKRGELKSYVHDIETLNNTLSQENQKLSEDKTALLKQATESEKVLNGQVTRIEILQRELNSKEHDLQDLQNRSENTSYIKSMNDVLIRLAWMARESYFEDLLSFYQTHNFSDKQSDEGRFLASEPELSEGQWKLMRRLIALNYVTFESHSGIYFLTEKGVDLWSALELFYQKA